MKVNVSFEFFPPKNQNIMQFRNTAAILEKMQPNFFSVTFGAGGSTRDGSLETIHLLKTETQIPVAPHLSCISSHPHEIHALLQQYQVLGLKRIVALRGDLPTGTESVGQLNYACDLVAYIRQQTGDYFHIEVAAYPEVHPQAESPKHDIESLKKKFDAGANSAITQYFFNPDAYFYFRDQCAKEQIFNPITPGIMPITHFDKLMRFSGVCGAEVPRWLSKRLEAYQDDVESIKAFGLEVVYNLCQKLIEGGVPGLHFYTLNQAETTVMLLQMLGREHSDFSS